MSTRDPRADLVRIFYEIGRALARGDGYESVVRAIVRAAIQLTRGDAASVLVRDAVTGALVHRSGHGLERTERDISFAPGEGVAGWVAEHGRAAVVRDTRKDPRFAVKPGQRRKMLSLLCVPVTLRSKVVGVLTVSSPRRNAFTASDARLLALLAAQIAIDLDNLRLETLASRDPLTGVANRRRFDDVLGDKLREARRTRSPLAVALLDLDHFKRINDRLGHPVGDAVLRMAVERWQTAIRGVDLLARLGGEEFGVILPGADAARASDVAERLRLRISRSPFRTRKGNVRVTTSVGVAVSARGRGTTARLLDAADRALYAAKEGGRDCARVAKAIA